MGGCRHGYGRTRHLVSKATLRTEVVMTTDPFIDPPDVDEDEDEPDAS
jgi:hypothetical protein